MSPMAIGAIATTARRSNVTFGVAAVCLPVNGPFTSVTTTAGMYPSSDHIWLFPLNARFVSEAGSRQVQETAAIRQIGPLRLSGSSSNSTAHLSLTSFTVPPA